jgi:type II secretory pathway component PulC
VSRRLLVINVALGVVSVVLAVGIFRTLLAKRPLPPPSAPRAVSAPAPAAPAAAGDVGPGAYEVIVARNLFNASRSETVAVVAAAPVAKPILHGVVINGSKSRAFLEDPTFKRVAGYSVGDTVGGGTIDKISDDRVVITRPEGPLEILLQDPAKPRATPTAAAAPAQVGSPPSRVPPAIPQLRPGFPPQRQPGQ